MDVYANVDTRRQARAIGRALAARLGAAHVALMRAAPAGDAVPALMLAQAGPVARAMAAHRRGAAALHALARVHDLPLESFDRFADRGLVRACRRRDTENRKIAATPHAQRGPARESRIPGLGRLNNGNPAGDFRLAPRCGARTRAGGCCRQPAMANGRCRLHGGKSTGPRTADGRARIAAAHRRHGVHAAAHRAERRAVRAAVGALEPLVVQARAAAGMGWNSRRLGPYLAAMQVPFVKMHGLGNDFVIIDARKRAVALDAARARAIADRHTGVGCDQLIVIEPAAAGADAFMRIRNADGGEVGACGNAARCVASLLMRENGARTARIATASGLLAAEGGANGAVTVDMGVPRFAWRDVPLAAETDTLHVNFALGPLRDPVALSMGNPHAVFFVPDAEAVDLAALGPQIEHHALFPERVNVGVAQVRARDRVRLRVWERGAGITQACGTGACAAAVAGARRGLTDRSVTVALDGGELRIDWRADDHVMMSGPVATSFTGELAL